MVAVNINAQNVVGVVGLCFLNKSVDMMAPRWIDICLINLPYRNIISFGLFISPVPTLYKIWKKRATEDFSPLPYIVTLQTCMLWVFYGLPIVHPNSLLIVTINSIGIFLEIIYLIVYFIYAPKKQRLYVLKFMAGEMVLMAVVVTVTLTCAHAHTKRSLIVGIVCVIFNICMYASPLFVMRMVIQTKSVKYMPFSLSLTGFLNAICWMAYAFIQFDLFMLIPNGLGVLFGAAQLILYGCYYRSTVWDDDEKPKLEVQLPASASTVGRSSESSELQTSILSSK